MNEEIKNMDQRIAENNLLIERLSRKLDSCYTDLILEIRKVSEICNLYKDYHDEEASDEQYELAKSIVIKEQKASTSYIQRKLRIGYARAAHIVDMLEEYEVIGPANGSKPRAVLIKNE